MKNLILFFALLCSVSSYSKEKFNPIRQCDYKPNKEERVFILALAKESSSKKVSNICAVTTDGNELKEIRFVQIVDEDDDEPKKVRNLEAVITKENIGSYNDDLDDVSGLDTPRGVVVTHYKKAVIVRSSDLDEFDGGSAIINYLRKYNFFGSNDREEVKVNLLPKGDRWYFQTTDGEALINEFVFIRHSRGVSRVDFKGIKDLSRRKEIKGRLRSL